MTLCGWPISCASAKPLTRANTAFPAVITPRASVVEKNISLTPKGRAMSRGMTAGFFIGFAGQLRCLRRNLMGD